MKMQIRLAAGSAAFALAAAVGMSASAGWGPDPSRATPGTTPRKPVAPVRNPDKERIIAMNGGREPIAPTQDPGTLRGPGCTGTSFVFTPNLAIPDLATANDIETVVGAGTISDVNVELNITHTWQGDVTVTLIHDGVTVPLISRPGLTGPTGCCGDSADNFGVVGGAPFVLDDQAVPAQTYDTPQIPLPGLNNVAGSWLPDADGVAAHLSDFNGHPIAGTWTLHVEDGAGGDVGVVTRWALCINTPPPAPTGRCCVGNVCSVTTFGACANPPGWVSGGNCITPDLPAHSPYSRTPNMAIPDANVAGITDTVTIADTFTVGHLTLALDIHDHTYDSDLIVTLTSPAATAVVVWNHLCVGTDGINCVLDDTAAVVTCPAAVLTPVTGNVKPSNPLSVFRGQPITGVWTLSVADTVGADTGTLFAWSLTAYPIGPSACVPVGPDCFTRGPAGALGSGCQTPTLTHTRPQNAGHYTRGGANGAGDATECIGDWDGDGCVAPADVASFVASWFFSANNPGNLDGDIDCDGAAVPADVATFVQHWFGGLNTPIVEGCV